MRVKSVPRHKVTQNVTATVKRSLHYTFRSDPSEDSLSEDEKHESLKCRLHALGVCDQYKAHPLRSSLLDYSGTNRQCPSFYNQASLWELFHPDVNNNTRPAHCSRSDICSMAGPSSSMCTAYSAGESPYGTSLIDATMEKALNLSIKDSPQSTAENTVSSPSPSNPDDKLKETVLYKIMTDPTFLESIKRNKQQKKFLCQFCKQEFSNGDELYKHLDVKKDESNQVVCCACKKTFAQKRYLRYHQRCHSERTKFTCDICTKKYTRLDNLTRHNVFHVNPDKFPCSSCEKTFARKDLLNKHQKCHDNKYRFFCEACQKYFKGPLTLENHKKIFHRATRNAVA